jgi:hypothetical protein
MVRHIRVELSQTEVRYILYALGEMMTKREAAIQADPDVDDDLTPMYAEDVLHLRDIQERLRQEAILIFGEQGLTVSYKSL